MLLGYGQPGVRSSLIPGTAGAASRQLLTATVTRGVCAGIVEDAESGAWFKTDALMLPGQSGGPVVAQSGQSGRVVGWCISSAIDRVMGGGGSYACGLSVVRPLNALLPALGGVLAAHGLLESNGESDSEMLPKYSELLPSAREAAVRRAVAGARPCLPTKSRSWLEHELRKLAARVEQTEEQQRTPTLPARDAPPRPPPATRRDTTGRFRRLPKLSLLFASITALFGWRGAAKTQPSQKNASKGPASKSVTRSTLDTLAVELKCRDQ